MKTKKIMLCVIGFMLLFTVAAASAADGPKLTFKFKTINVPSALQTLPNGINDQGVTVGQYEDQADVYHGYIFKGGKVKTLNDPNGGFTGSYGINFNYDGKAGEMVVGAYTNSSGNQVGFLFQNGTFTDITGPNGDLPAAANGINDAGAIVGGYDGNSGFLLEGTNYTYPLNVPGAVETYAQDINDNGVITLVWKAPSGAYHGAFTTNNGATYSILKDVPHSGTSGSFPTCIDNGQDVTFTWFDSNGLEHAALCTTCLTGHPKYHTFDYPKALQTNASCVNDKKSIVGYYQKKNGRWSGFEATYK
jgi:uncharacterized membrane protein